MWKKDDVKPAEQAATPMAAPAPEAPRQPERPAMAPRATGEHALIGRSITIRGDVTGDEDLVIQGRIEGSVDLRENSVTVGGNGEVHADITGRNVTVEGQVVGNIDGGEQVTLRSSAFVQGDITAPRVVLENGARFRGLVDMGEVDPRGAGSTPRARGAEPRKGGAPTPNESQKGKGAPNGKDQRPDAEVQLAV